MVQNVIPVLSGGLDSGSKVLILSDLDTGFNLNRWAFFNVCCSKMKTPQNKKHHLFWFSMRRWSLHGCEMKVKYLTPRHVFELRLLNKTIPTTSCPGVLHRTARRALDGILYGYPGWSCVAAGDQLLPWRSSLVGVGEIIHRVPVFKRTPSYWPPICPHTMTNARL